jgi:plastocyanin
MVSPMRRPLSVVGASLAALFAIAALVAWPIPSKAAVTCGPEPGQTADAKVILQGRQFQPQAVTLSAAGQTICWEHQDPGIGHTITSDAAPGEPDYFRFPKDAPPCDSESDLDCFNYGEVPWKLQLNSGGTYPYHCELHPSTMKGVITVQGGGGPTVTTRPPAAATTTTRAPTTGTTGTTVGTLTQETTTTSVEETTTSSSSTTSTIDFTTTTSEIAQSSSGDDDDDEASGLLKTVGAVLLAAVIAALIPAWRRLT